MPDTARRPNPHHIEMVNFGELLRSSRYEPWAKAYIDYDVLKAILEPLEKRVKADKAAARGGDASGDGGATPADDDGPQLPFAAGADEERPVDIDEMRTDVSVAFEVALHAELRKVNSHYEDVADEHARQMLRLQDLRNELAEHPRELLRREVMQRESQLAESAAMLHEFCQINYKGFFKILKKHDKLTQRNLMGPFMQIVDRQPFRDTSVRASQPDWEERVGTETIYDGAVEDRFKDDVEEASVRLAEVLLALRAATSSAERIEVRTKIESDRLELVRSVDTRIHAMRGKSAVTGSLLAAKLTLFSMLMARLGRELGLTSPEHEAAIERLINIHGDLFKSYLVVQQPQAPGGSDGDAVGAAGGPADGEPSATPGQLGPEERMRALEFARERRRELRLGATTAFKLNLKGIGDGNADAGEDGMSAPPTARRGSDTSQEVTPTTSRFFTSAPDAPSVMSWKFWAENFPRPPMTEWLPKYQWKKDLRRDLVSGLTIAVFVVPQGLAYATLANVPPIQGLYAAMIAPLIYTIFGTSKHGAVGPMSIPCLLVGAATEKAGATTTEERIAVASMLALMVGVFSIAMGALRLGFLVRFISNPVLKGFASAAAIVTMVSVSKDIFGVKAAKSAFIHEALPNLVSVLPKTHAATLVLGVAALLTLVALKVGPQRLERLRFLKRVPGSLVTLVIFVLVTFTVCQTGGLEGRHPTHVTPVYGAGASAPAPAYKAALTTYECSHTTVKFAYGAVGSTAGRHLVAERAAVFGGSGVPPSRTPDLAGNGVMALPTLVAPVVPVVNLPVTSTGDATDASPVVLPCEVLGRIYAGDVQFWDDEAITGVNPLLVGARALPHTTISIAGRADGSGMTDVVAQVLRSCSPEFAAVHDVTNSSYIQYPPTVAVTPVAGNSGVVDYVRGTAFSLSFTTLAHAKEAGLSIASVTYGDSGVISATAESAEAAVVAALSAGAGGDAGDADGSGGGDTTPVPLGPWHEGLLTHLLAEDDAFAAVDPQGANTTTPWPFTEASYLLVPVSDVSCGQMQEALQFWSWFYTSPDVEDALTSKGYAPLPSAVRNQAVSMLVEHTRCGATDDPVLYVEPPPAFALGYWGCSDGDFVRSDEVLTCGGGIKLVGDVPASLPLPEFPDMTLSEASNLVSDALLITIVAFMESIAVAKMYAMRFSYDVSPSQELIALGIANVGGALMRAFPVMNAFGRSAVNVDSGAKSPLSLLISSFALVAILFVITPALFFLPKAVLSAVVLVAVAGLVDVKGALRLWRSNRMDLVTMASAFFATLFLGVELGILVSAGTSLVIFVYLSTTPKVVELGRLRGTVAYRPLEESGHRGHAIDRIPRVRILSFYGPVWFANAPRLKEEMLHSAERYDVAGKRYSYRPWDAIVLDCANISFFDSTSVTALQEVQSYLESIGIRFLLAHCNLVVVATLTQSAPNITLFHTVHDAVVECVRTGKKPIDRLKNKIRALTSLAGGNLRQLAQRIDAAERAESHAEDSD